MSDHQWCVAHDINPSTFYNWVKRLRQKGGYEIPQPANSSSFSPAPKQDVVKMEILHKKHFGSYSLYDGTVSCNITVTGCTFRNVQRGVGTHAGVAGSYLQNIQISDNYFENIPGYTIIATNYKNSRITNNRIVNAASSAIMPELSLKILPVGFPNLRLNIPGSKYLPFLY